MEIKALKEKGKRFERFILQQIEEMGLGAGCRTPGSGSGKKKGDVFTSLDFLPECKNEANPKWLPSIDQAKRQAEQGNYFKEKWVLFTRDPRYPEFEQVYAVLDLWQFLTLLKKNKEPLIKEPDKEFKWKCEKAKQALKEVLNYLEP
jgi:Holliday junction resolvase